MTLIPYQKSKLNNGVRVLLAPLNNTRAVTVLVLVKTGSRNEDKRVNGVSHFLEHMFFKGTKRRPTKEEIASTLDGVGAEFNAFTTEEITGYYVKVEKTHFTLALDMVSDILLNSTFPASEIARERKVILEEINMYYDNPSRYAFELWEQLLYGGQPAGWPIAGTKESVSNIRRADLANYFGQQYRADNIVVCVAGNVSGGRAKKEIARYFAKTRKGKGETSPRTHDSQSGIGVTNHFRKTGQTHILLGVRGFSLSDERRYPMSLLATVLGGNMSSRLFMTVREKRGLAYSVRTMANSSSDAGFLVTYAGVDNKRVEEALKAVWEEYKRTARQKIGKDELAKAKNYIRGKTMLGLESSDDVAEYLGAQEILLEKITDPEEELKKIESATAEDVREVANDVFLKEKANVVLVGPYRNLKRVRTLFKA